MGLKARYIAQKQYIKKTRAKKTYNDHISGNLVIPRKIKPCINWVRGFKVIDYRKLTLLKRKALQLRFLIFPECYGVNESKEIKVLINSCNYLINKQKEDEYFPVIGDWILILEAFKDYQKGNNLKASSNPLTTDDYKKYLSSDHWQYVKTLVIKRDFCRCQNKKRSNTTNQLKKCGSQSKLEVHHKTYENLGDELNHLDDLITLCSKCREEIHALS